MKKTMLMALCASSLGLGACGLDIPDLNNPSLESLQDAPTRASIEAASTGLLLGNRAGMCAQTGYVAHLGILGRELFTLAAAAPRYVTEMVRGEQLAPGSPASGVRGLPAAPSFSSASPASARAVVILPPKTERSGAPS